MPTFPSTTLNFTNQGTTYSTFLTGIRGDNIVGMYVDANNQDQGLLYDLQSGMWIPIDYPSAVSTVPYGPSFGSYAAGMDIVGSYKLTGEATDNGFLFDSSAAPGSQWTTLDYPDATNTIPHSTFNGLVVGNWDVSAIANPDFQTYPLAGNAFIYNISTATFTTNDKPGAISTTAYGIYDNMIAGGYADTPAAQGGCAAGARLHL
jgi:subtilase-type serine protease